MPNFAVILDNKVINIIVADSKESAEQATNNMCVEYTDSNPAYIGLGYDGTTFEQPPIIETSIDEELAEESLND